MIEEDTMRIPAPEPGRTVTIAILLLLSSVAARTQSTDIPPACEDAPTYHALDFWVGEWEVFVNDRRVGVNRIDKVLDGCAIIENWSARDGGDGKSLFFVDYDGQWVQVWVSQWARTPGGVKEKVMVDDPPEGAVRFQGVIRHPEAGEWLDRTTLTPLEDGAVRQVIEISEDNGASWNPTFDAIYRPLADDRPEID
jgi:hypothetical protein